MISVKLHELKKIYKKHFECYKSINGYDKSKRLLLFYSVECGLKCLILKDIGQSTTDAIFQHYKYDILKSDGHNIKLMIKLLGFEGTFNLKSIDSKNFITSVGPSQYNQMWRYGIDIEPNGKEQSVEVELVRIAEWLDPKV